MFESSTNARTVGAFDAIAKDVVPHSLIVASPGDDARPGERAPEGATPKGLAPSCPSDHPSHDPREGSQKTLKCLAPAGTDQQMQMGAHVGKLVDTHSATRNAGAERLSNPSFVVAH